MKTKCPEPSWIESPLTCLCKKKICLSTDTTSAITESRSHFKWGMFYYSELHSPNRWFENIQLFKDFLIILRLNLFRTHSDFSNTFKFYDEARILIHIVLKSVRDFQTSSNKVVKCFTAKCKVTHIVNKE